MYFVPTFNLKCKKKKKNQINLNLFRCFVPHSLLVMPVRETNSLLLFLLLLSQPAVTFPCHGAFCVSRCALETERMCCKDWGHKAIIKSTLSWKSSRHSGLSRGDTACVAAPALAEPTLAYQSLGRPFSPAASRGTGCSPAGSSQLLLVVVSVGSWRWPAHL